MTAADRDAVGGTGTEPFRVAVTGTPGTGKSTGTERLEARIDAGEYAGRSVDELEDVAVEPGRVDVVHLNDAIEREGLYDDVDEQRDSVVVDLDALATWVDEYVAATDAAVVVLDSHLAHHLDVDRVAVLRCHPETLHARLSDRGEPDTKAEENAESEALDVVLGQSVDAHGTDAVYEIETTDADPDAVADAIASVLTGSRDPSAGTVDYIDHI